MACLHLDARDQALAQHRRLLHGLGGAVLDAVNALAVAELAAVQRGTAAGAVGQAFGAGFRADVQGVFQAAAAASVAAYQRLLHRTLYLVQHLGAKACGPQRLTHGPAKGLAQAVAAAEHQRMHAVHQVIACFSLSEASTRDSPRRQPACGGWKLTAGKPGICQLACQAGAHCSRL